MDPNATNKLRANFPGTVNQNAQPGDLVIISPQADMGYVCKGVTVETADGTQVELVSIDNGYGNYQFTMPDADVTITADFERDAAFKSVEVYNAGTEKAGSGQVTVGDCENGSITVSGHTVTATPDAGYRFLQGQRRG